MPNFYLGPSQPVNRFLSSNIDSLNNFFYFFIYSGSEASVVNIDDGGTVWSRKQHAVSVRHAFKQYGSKSKPNPVLVNLNMTVAKGTM